MNCDGVSNLLSAYLDGELTSGELLRVEDHLRRCHACADEVDSLRQTMALVASLEEVELPASFQVQLHQRLVALGPPLAAARRAPAAPAWQRNVKRWGVPAAAAAAALAIAVTNLNSGNLNPGILSVATHDQKAPQTQVEPAPSNNVAVNPSTETPQDPKPSGGKTDTPPVKPEDPQALPYVPPGPIDTKGGSKAADATPVKPVETDNKQMVYAYNLKVKGTLDPKTLETLKGEITTVEQANNTVTVAVPAKDVAEWKTKLTSLYWPNAVVEDASVDLSKDIADAQYKMEAAGRQLAQLKGNENEPMAQAEFDQAIVLLDLLRKKTIGATFVVTFTP